MKAAAHSSSAKAASTRCCTSWKPAATCRRAGSTYPAAVAWSTALHPRAPNNGPPRWHSGPRSPKPSAASCKEASMNTPEALNHLVVQLVRRGLPVDYAERAVAEFDDHHRDLLG